MATVTKDFRIKSGLVVEGTNGTINGSDIITEDAITGGTQTNIAVTYDPQSKTVSFVAENGIADSTTDDLAEGENNLYFTEQRAIDAVGGSATPDNTPNTVVKRDENGDFAAGAINALDGIQIGIVGPGYQTGTLNKDESGHLRLANANQPVVLGPESIVNGTNVYLNNTNDFSNLVATHGHVAYEIDALDTDDIEEGSNNLYFTDQRAYDAAKNSASDIGLSGELAKYDGGGALTAEAVVLNGNGVFTDFVTARTNQGLTLSGGSFDVVLTAGNNVYLSSATAGNEVATQGNIETHSDLTTGVHGVTGDVVGTTDSQILSNKTLGNDLDAGGFKIVDLATPEQADDAATKAYVDSVAEGLHVHASAVAATTENLPLFEGPTGSPEGGLAATSVDGVTLADGNRVLVKNQTGPEQNGIYVFGDGKLLRAADFDSPAEVDGGDFIFVTGGNTYADTGWVQTADAVVAIGNDPIVFTQFSGAGTYLPGYGLNLDGNTFEVDATEIASQTDLNNAVSDLTDAIDGYLDPSTGTTIEYIDDQDAATLLAANGYSDALVAAGNATATPTYLALDINDVAKQVAATYNGQNGVAEVAYSWSKSAYRSAELLVKVQYGSHTEVSKVILTLDSSDNIAITEYAVVGTNGSMSTISASIDAGNVQLVVTPNGDATILTVGTLLV